MFCHLITLLVVKTDRAPPLINNKNVFLPDYHKRTLCFMTLLVRVDMVVTIHDNLLTQQRHIPMGQFRANIFLIPTTSNYLWASKVFKNQSSKSQLFRWNSRSKMTFRAIVSNKSEVVGSISYILHKI